MTIVHLRITAHSRAKGANAVEIAARYAGVALEDRQRGVHYDYREGTRVVHREILGPEDVSPWWADRGALWNEAEWCESRRDARVAREYQIALPHELGDDARIGLARAWARCLIGRYGVVIDVTVHAPPPEGDSRNHFAKLLSTSRTVTPVGLGGKTPIELGHGAGPKELRLLHRQWREVLGQALAAS